MLLVDTGPLYAAAAKNDKHHTRCADLFRDANEPLLIPEVVVTEAAYMVGSRLGPRAELHFARLLAAAGLMAEALDPADWDRVSDLMEQYLDFPLGLVDASIIAIAERLNIERIATLDRRHFSAIRPVHCERFTLLP